VYHAIAPGAFPKLRCLKMDTWPILQPGAMPRLKSVELHVHVRVLRFDNFDFHDFYKLSYLRLLEKVHVRINCLGAKIEAAEEAEAALRHAVQSHPNRPRLILNRVGQCVDDKQVLLVSLLFFSIYPCHSYPYMHGLQIRSLRGLRSSQLAQVMPRELLRLGSGTFGTVYKASKLRVLFNQYKT
jgi:hypothetical protein